MRNAKRYTTQTFTHRVDHDGGRHRHERRTSRSLRPADRGEQASPCVVASRQLTISGHTAANHRR
jgi:hypothetical protein